MWAIRRASNPVKRWGFSTVTSRACSAKLEIKTSRLEGMPGIFKCSQEIYVLSLKSFHNSTNVSSKFSMERCGLSSQAGTESSEEENDLDDGFSELEMAPSADAIKESNADVEMDCEMVSETESAGEDDNIDEPCQNDLELDTETDPSEKKLPYRSANSKLFEAIMTPPGQSVHSALDKWVEKGNDLDRNEISLAMLNLRKRRMYARALQFSDWLESKKRLEFIERDYASRVDLIAKVRGFQKAEKYIENIPESFKGEVVYRTLLANHVSANNMKKAEDTFNKMKDLGFPLTIFACNQLLLLYKRVEKKKIADVLLLMEKENVKPSLFTYRILIETKGISNDITGINQIVETMKAEGIEPDINLQFRLAKHYVSAGLREKAEAILKEMEGDNLKENRSACQHLLPLYGALGKADEVERVWKICESNPWPNESAACIQAWGKLKRVEEAEAVFERMLKAWTKLSPKHWFPLLKVYVDNKMLVKGKDFVKRMGTSGCKIGPLTWDALIKLYVEAGEVDKASSILQKAVEQKQGKPLLTSYMVIMDRYAKRGDIHNTEKVFHQLRQAGYVFRPWQFQSLVHAYINAKAPAYGMRERMKADNVFPNKALAAQLAEVDAFRKTQVSELLD